MSGYIYIIIIIKQLWKNKNIKGIEHINQIYTVIPPHCQEIFIKKKNGKIYDFQIVLGIYRREYSFTINTLYGIIRK